MCFRMECFNSHFISRKWHYYFYSVFYEGWGFSFDIPLCFISFHLSHHFRGVLLFLRCLTGKWMVDALNYTAITWLQTESTNTTSVAFHVNQNSVYYPSVANVWVAKLVWNCGFFAVHYRSCIKTLRELWLFYNL